MVRVNFFTLMVINLTVHGLMIKLMDMVYIIMLIVTYIKGIGRQISNMGMV